MKKPPRYKFIITDEAGETHVFRDESDITVEIATENITVWRGHAIIAEYPNWKNLSRQEIITYTHINHSFSGSDQFGYHCVMDWDNKEFSITMKSTGDMGELAHYLRLGIDYRKRASYTTTNDDTSDTTNDDTSDSRDIVELEKLISKTRKELHA